MLIDYQPTRFGKPKVMTRGVVLNSLFELRELERSEHWTSFPELSGRFSCGICDSLENLFEVYPELLFDGEGSREFVVNMVCIDRDDQPEFDGWRWDHWGDYIGNQFPTTEYLYDEPEIERVYTYRIYEKID